jgi:beta-lactamase class A
MGRRFAVMLGLVAIAAVAAPLAVDARAPDLVSPPDLGPVSTSSADTTTATLSATAAAAAAIAFSAEVNALQQLVATSGAAVGVTVVELGGSSPRTWSLDGGAVFTAASTYKLVALMMEAQNIASGATDPNGYVCFQPDDYEDGWFDDYTPDACFTRNELASRAAQQSDNTAGHMLVRDVGGADAVNAWAVAHGATNSSFFDGNTTTSADLAALWVAEADGSLGGAPAQSWLYPLLTGTTTEQGVPAGVAAGSTVVHKTGTIDAVVNDAALVTGGPDGAYVLIVMTDGLGGSAAWDLIAAISAGVWQTEESRPLA